MRNTKVQDIHNNERNSMKYGRLEGLSGSLTFFLNIQLAEVALEIFCAGVKLVPHTLLIQAPASCNSQMEDG